VGGRVRARSFRRARAAGRGGPENRGALALKLLPSEQARLAKTRAVNPDAFDAYLKGAHAWIKLTRATSTRPRSTSSWRSKRIPTTRRPTRACHGLGLPQPDEHRAAQRGRAEDERAALKAVALDDTLADAHYAVAALKSWHEWDLAGADAEWRRAIEINPNFPDARAFYSHYLYMMNRPDEGMAQIERAIKLDPFNVLLQSLYAADLVFAARYDDAAVEARKALRMQPGAPVASAMLAIASRMKGTPQETLAATKAYYAIYEDPDVNRAFDRGYAEGGYPGAARRAADALAAHFHKMYLTPGTSRTCISTPGPGPGHRLAREGRGGARPNMPYIGVMPHYAPLRSEPRFQALLRRIGLPPS